MIATLSNHVSDRWVEGKAPFTELSDPVTGELLARASAKGLDLETAYEHARATGGRALRALSYGERAALLAKLVDVLKANRDRYIDLSVSNSGTTRADARPDVDGAIFTLGYYARLGKALGDARYLLDGSTAPLDRNGDFLARHVLVPTRGLVLCINAFNFPAWGLWEKAAPALLSGVPVVAKPATATCLLTHRMVADVVEAGILPPGALSLICGSGDGLLDALQHQDLLSFTGAAETAASLRMHPAVSTRSVRMNAETDSLNSMLVDPAADPGGDIFSTFIREAVKELCVKSGQRCTAPRRLFVQQDRFDAAREALAASLGSIVVGDPRNESVRMGALVSRAQHAQVQRDITRLASEAEMAHDGAATELVDADPAIAACMAPTLLAVRDASSARLVHEIEAFGPVTTLVAYRDTEEAHRLIAAGGGSLVTSIYTTDPAFGQRCALELAHEHGRLHVVTPEVAQSHSGHGNVMPASLHGGPGRAGGGEELGGLRALHFYHRRCAVQAAAPLAEALDTGAIELAI